MKSPFCICFLILSIFSFSCKHFSVESITSTKNSEVTASSAPLAMKAPVACIVHNSTNVDEEAFVEYDRNKPETPEEEPEDLSAKSMQNSDAKNAKKIIKDGNMRIQAKDVFKSKKELDSIVYRVGAYYETEVLQNDHDITSYDVKIRVPAMKFETLIENVENGSDEIITKSIVARDVTEEYIDIETRLKNKHAYLDRYLTLLGKASNVKDILSIQENIRVIQEEIESKEGRLKYLNDQVAFSSLDVQLFRNKEYKYVAAPKAKFGERLKSAFANGWWAVVDFVLALFASWPLLIFTAVGLLLARRWWKRRKLRIAK